MSVDLSYTVPHHLRVAWETLEIVLGKILDVVVSEDGVAMIEGLGAGFGHCQRWKKLTK